MSISAMKQALKALEGLNELSKGPSAICLPAEIDTAMDTLRQAIAEAEKQEPVAWMTHTNDLMPLFHMARKSALNWETQPTPLYTAPVHASDISQECVDETAKREHELVGACVTCGAPHGFWLSAPPTDFISPSVVKAISKREWVGLTDEDIYKVIEENIPPQLNTLFDMAKWVGGVIEAKLKEKNA